jgi:hypothetical protein
MNPHGLTYKESRMSDERIVSFVGIQSGDYESACYDVSAEEYVRLTGEKPTKSDRSYFYAGRYRFYPPSCETEGLICSVMIRHKYSGQRAIKYGETEPPMQSWDESKEQPDED